MSQADQAEVPFRALVVDDEVLYAEAVGRELSRRGVICDLAHSAQQALRQAERGVYQVVLLDQRLPDHDGISIIGRLLAHHVGTSVVVMTAYETIPNAVLAIRQGAEDYIVKEASLEPIVERVLEIRRRDQVRRAGSGWQEHGREGLLGRSPGMIRVVQALDQLVASPDTTVLLTGETGVGKEVAARYLHRRSRPRNSSMVAVDCVALPESLAESLLFGHEKGAFTGAEEARPGTFEEAGEGTVFLDEIGDMDARLQGRLLRVLEGRCFRRLGSRRDIPLRARVVAATNRDLTERLEQGRFRMDLYQRLSVFPIHLPSLRERGEDILLLAEHFRTFFSDKLGKTIPPLAGEVAGRLMAYSFPGNVRELKNIIERAVIITESGRIEPAHLPRRVLAGEAGAPSSRSGPAIPVDFVVGIDTMESLEKRMIRQAMRRAGNVKAEAARLLGLSRFQLLRRMEKYGMGSRGGEQS